MYRFVLLACALSLSACDCDAPCADCETPCCADGGNDAGEDGATSDSSCVRVADGTACEGGRLCIRGACVASRCGDGFTDVAQGEACDLGPGCAADCTVLPCAPRACSTAARDEAGTCVYTPANEGMACEDANACTTGDRCEGGTCVGDARASMPAVDSVLTSYGAEPLETWVEGLASFVSDDRVLFLESNNSMTSRITLAEVGPSGLSRIAETESVVPYDYLIRSVVYWGYEPTTHVVPMGPNRFVVIGARPYEHGAMELFEHTGTSLTSLGVTRLPINDSPSDDDDAMTILGAAARADALFLCGNTQARRMRAYTLDESTRQFVKVADVATPTGGCGELTLSADGNRLYLAGNGGYRVFDVTDPAQLTSITKTVVIPDRYIEDIDVSDTHVVVLTAKVAGELDEIVVFDTDGVRLGAIDSPERADPIGFALSGTDLFATFQTYATATMGSSLVTRVHALAEPGMPEKARFSTQVPCCGGDASVMPVARRDLAVLAPFRDVVRFDAASQTLTPVTGPRHGSLRSVFARSSSEVIALGPFSAHRIDLSIPSAPGVIEGGMTLSHANEGFQIVLAPDHPTGRLVEPRGRAYDPLTQRSSAQRFSVVDARGQDVSLAGSGVMSGTESDVIAIAEGHVFQVSAEGGESHRVRRFTIENLIGASGGSWLPDLEMRTPFADGPSFSRLTERAVGASRAGDQLLVQDARSASGQPTSFGHVWLGVSDGGITRLADAHFAADVVSWAVDIAIEGDIAIVIGETEFFRLRRDGSTIVREAYLRNAAGGTYQRILGFDGERVTVARREWHAATPTRAREQLWLVEVRDVESFALLASYPMPDDPRTMAVAGGHVVFGTPSAMVVATPACVGLP